MSVDVVPIPRPRKRITATPAEWRELREKLIGEGTRCVGCNGWFSGGQLSLHHVVPRSLGGDDVELNLVALCGSGTARCHGRYEGKTRGWRRVAANIRAWIFAFAPRADYVRGRKSAEFIDNYYPKEDATDAA